MNVGHAIRHQQDEEVNGEEDPRHCSHQKGPVGHDAEKKHVEDSIGILELDAKKNYENLEGLDDGVNLGEEKG